MSNRAGVVVKIIATVALIVVNAVVLPSAVAARESADKYCHQDELSGMWVCKEGCPSEPLCNCTCGMECFNPPEECPVD